MATPANSGFSNSTYRRKKKTIDEHWKELEASFSNALAEILSYTTPANSRRLEFMRTTATVQEAAYSVNKLDPSQWANTRLAKANTGLLYTLAFCTAIGTFHFLLKDINNIKQLAAEFKKPKEERKRTSILVGDVTQTFSDFLWTFGCADSTVAFVKSTPLNNSQVPLILTSTFLVYFWITAYVIDLFVDILRKVSDHLFFKSANQALNCVREHAEVSPTMIALLEQKSVQQRELENLMMKQHTRNIVRSSTLIVGHLALTVAGNLVVKALGLAFFASAIGCPPLALGLIAVTLIVSSFAIATIWRNTQNKKTKAKEKLAYEKLKKTDTQISRLWSSNTRAARVVDTAKAKLGEMSILTFKPKARERSQARDVSQTESRSTVVLQHA